MTFIVAELGINHNGSLDLAKKLIDGAYWAGADAIKLQKRDIETVYRLTQFEHRKSPWGETLGAQKRGLEFDEEAYGQIDLYCRQKKIPWFASAWDLPSLQFLEKFDLNWNKIASAMVTNLEFVQAVAKQAKPTFISTAMCTHDDIEAAIVKFASGITLMHCVATYPAAESDLNLRCIHTLKERYGLPVGYSGHESSVSPSVIAAAMGAVAIERHLTIDRAMYGSDQAASLEPEGFKLMVDMIRKIPEISGDGIKRILPAEEAVAKKLRYWL